MITRPSPWPRRIAGVLAVAVMLVAGTLVGRSLDRSDEPTTTTIIVEQPDGAEPIELVAVPLIAPIAFGDAPPDPVDPDDEMLGLSEPIGTTFVIADPGPLADLAPPPQFVTGSADAPDTDRDIVDLTQAPPVAPDEWLDLLDLPPDGLEIVADPTAPAESTDGPAPAADTDTDTDTLTGTGTGTGTDSDTSDGSTRPDDPGDADGDARERPAPAPAPVDPCAPRGGGAVGDDCPDGLASTVLAIETFMLSVAGVTPEALGPPTPSCPTFRPTVEQAIVQIVTDVPVAYRIELGLPDGVIGPVDLSPRTITGSTSPEARAEWRPTGEIRHCSMFDGLAPATSYPVTVVATADDGREVTATTIITTGPYDRPPVQLDTGSFAIAVTAALRDDEWVDIYAWEPSTGFAWRGCGDPGRVVYGSQPITATTSFWADAGYDPSFTRSTYREIFADWSRNTVICVRTHAGNSREGGLLFEQAFLVEPPDVLQPVVEVVGIELSGVGLDGDSEIGIEIGRTRDDGQVRVCGGWWGRGSGGVIRPDVAVACGTTDTADLPFSIFRDDYIIRARFRPAAGSARTTEVAIDAGGSSCGPGPDGCTAPPTRTYRVPFGPEGITRSACAGTRGRCEPPPLTGIAGSAQIQVRWVVPDLAGREPRVARVIRPLVGQEASPGPRLIDQPGFFAGEVPGLVRGALAADRPVEWEVRLAEGSCRGPATETVARSAAATVEFSLAFTDLCTDERITFVAELRDPATGTRSSWQGGVNWTYGAIRLDPATFPIEAILTAGVPRGSDSELWSLDTARVVLRTPNPRTATEIPMRIEHILPRADCTARPSHRPPGRVGYHRFGFAWFPLVDPIEVLVEVHLVRAEAGSRGGCRVTGERQVVSFTAVVSSTDVAGAGGIRIENPPDAPFPVLVQLRARP